MLKLSKKKFNAAGYLHNANFPFPSSVVCLKTSQALGLSGQVPQNSRIGGHAPGELQMASL